MAALETTAPTVPTTRTILDRRERAQATHELLLRAHRTALPERRRRLLEEVVLINRGVAEAVAARYRGRGVAADDLQQAAYEGLVKAVFRFDPELDNDLLTYAVPTIRGELQRYFRDHGWTVRPPRRLQELQWRVTRCIEELTVELGREPAAVEVQERLEITEAEYAEALVAFGCFSPTSLDQPLGSDAPAGSSLGDLIPEPHPQAEATDARCTLAPALRRLPERDQRIIWLRYFEDRTQEEIGVDLGVTQMQVSRLLTRILRDLRMQLGTLAA
jgi:RNA polymerase sigma-B factor